MPRPENTARVPRRRDGVWLRQTEAEASLLSPEGDRVHVLNDTALALWQLCDGMTTVEEMLDALSLVFAADPAVLDHDVRAIIDQLSEAGLLSWTNHPE